MTIIHSYVYYASTWHMFTKRITVRQGDVMVRSLDSWSNPHDHLWC